MLALRSERVELDTVFNDFSSFPFFIYFLARFCLSYPTFLFLILLICEKYEKGENIDSKTSKYRNSFNRLLFFSFLLPARFNLILIKNFFDSFISIKQKRQNHENHEETFLPSDSIFESSDCFLFKKFTNLNET